ncbi:MAG: nucleotide sugar dehydrogenase [Pseudomonadota bacterium]
MGYDVGIVGLGYVGLTLATALADVGMRVIGVEKRADVVDLTNRGKPHFSENGLEELLSYVVEEGALTAAGAFAPDDHCDVYVITVGTPLDADGKARLDYIQAATREVAANMKDGALVILRSTVKIGAARNVVAPILAETGKQFQIAMCPERTLEGKALHELRNLPQIIGADDEATRERAAHFFYKLTHTAVQVSSLEAAEIVKLVDNTYRDVQFAFANEVARLCDGFGVNALEVINGGKLGYSRTNVALPGLVGGPCLEKDPHILWQSAKDRGIDLAITRAARGVNENQPAETVEFIAEEFERRKSGKAPAIAILGMAFKGVPATDDLRGAMSLHVLAALRAKFADAEIRIHDPVASKEDLESVAPDCTVADDVAGAIAGADIAIIANNHPALAQWRPLHMTREMSDGAFIYDYWNHFSDLRAHELGDSYFAVGNATAGVKGGAQ